MSIHFSSPKSEKAFPETAILSCHWQQMLFLPRISVPPFVSFPIFFLSARVFFLLLVSFPVWYPVWYVFLHFSPFKIILLSCLPWFVLYCFHYLPPWGISAPFFFCISPSLPILFPSVPSAFRYAAVFAAALPADPGRDRPAQTLVRGAAGGNALSPNF